MYDEGGDDAPRDALAANEDALTVYDARALAGNDAHTLAANVQSPARKNKTKKDLPLVFLLFLLSLSLSLSLSRHKRLEALEPGNVERLLVCSLGGSRQRYRSSFLTTLMPSRALRI